MEQLTQALIQLIAAVLVVLIGFMADYVRKKIGNERLEKIARQLDQKQALARLAVLFAQQFYGDFDGPRKYRAASEWLAARARETGLVITGSEIQGLIEAAVKQAKDEFGSAWRGSGLPPDDPDDLAVLRQIGGTG